jgi:hypothetical protein
VLRTDRRTTGIGSALVLVVASVQKRGRACACIVTPHPQLESCSKSRRGTTCFKYIYQPSRMLRKTRVAITEPRTKASSRWPNDDSTASGHASLALRGCRHSTASHTLTALTHSHSAACSRRPSCPHHSDIGAGLAVCGIVDVTAWPWSTCRVYAISSRCRSVPATGCAELEPRVPAAPALTQLPPIFDTNLSFNLVKAAEPLEDVEQHRARKRARHMA